mgnify:CR=1 FL=1
MKKSILKTFLPLIGIILFIYILIKINITTIFDNIRHVNLFFLSIAICFVFIMLLFQTFKWYYIALLQKIPLTFSGAFSINLISNFYAFITPSKIGGVIRAEYLKQYTGNIGKGLYNFSVDKVLDLTSIILLALIFSFIFKDKLELPIGIFIFIFLFFILILLFFLNKNRSKFVLRFFYKSIIPQRLKEKLKIIFDSFYENTPKKRYFILFFIM